ncbi:MAG: hypothetical protein HYX75_21275 [Acidobacteria bacterium]|nr:hypothetical protein [Acidobacteriota bacterium]
MLRSIHLGLTLLMGVTVPASVAAPAALKAYVLDTEAQAVTTLDITTGQVLGRALVKAKHGGYAPTLELMNGDGHSMKFLIMRTAKGDSNGGL